MAKSYPLNFLFLVILAFAMGFATHDTIRWYQRFRALEELKHNRQVNWDDFNRAGFETK